MTTTNTYKTNNGKPALRGPVLPLECAFEDARRSASNSSAAVHRSGVGRNSAYKNSSRRDVKLAPLSNHSTTASFTQHDIDAVVERLHIAISRDLTPYAASTTSYTELHPVKAMYARRQLDDFTKKFVPASTSEAAIRQATIQSFLACQKRCHLVDLVGTEYFYPRRTDSAREHPSGFHEYPDHLGGQPAARRIILRARKLIAGVLGEFPFNLWSDRCSFGNGTNVGVSYADTSAERKLKYPLTGTKAAIEVFKVMVQKDALLRQALIGANEGQPPTDCCYLEVPGDNFQVVNKTATIGRGIAPPPVIDGFLQQGIKQLLTECLCTVGLDISILQEVHRWMVAELSLTGKGATIDLKDASNNWVCSAVRMLLGESPSWLRAFETCRSDVVMIDGKYVPIYSYALMGNAYCFPLETLLFWAISEAVNQQHTNPYAILPLTCERSDGISVYGDDCILPTENVEEFISILQCLGHVVNASKSHVEPSSPFRESCGYDAYYGVDIRPYCVIRPTHGINSYRREAWLYTVANGVFKKWINHFGPRFVVTSSFFTEVTAMLCSVARIKIVPPDFPEDSGLRDIGMGLLEPALVALGREIEPLGYDQDLQMRTFAFLSFHDKETRQVPDEVRLWLARHDYATSAQEWDGEKWCVSYVSPPVRLEELTYRKVLEILTHDPILTKYGPLPRHKNSLVAVGFGGVESSERVVIEPVSKGKWRRVSTQNKVYLPTLCGLDSSNNPHEPYVTQDGASTLYFTVRGGSTVRTESRVDRRKGRYLKSYCVRWS